MRVLLLTASLLLALPVDAAQAFMSIKDTSKDVKKVGRIEVLDFDYGTRSHDTVGDRSRPAGGPGSLSITIKTDMATPYLYQACSKGKAFDEVKIDLCRTAGDCDRVRYYEVVIDSIRISAGGDGPTEKVDLSYAKVKWEYVDIDPKGLSKRKRK